MSDMDASLELEAEVDETEHVPLSAEELAELEAETAELMDDVEASYLELKLGISGDEYEEY